MLLYEFEGKQLLSRYGVRVPISQIITSSNQRIEISHPFILKAQVLSGKRKAAGGVVIVNDRSSNNEIADMFKNTINQEKINTILVEEKINFLKEYFISITYDTMFNSPIVTFSDDGGTDIENRKTVSFPINPLTQKPAYPKSPEISAIIKVEIERLIDIFFTEDAVLLEINPLVETKDGMVALDAKINLDDNAFFRHEQRRYLARSVAGHAPSPREIEAKKIDAQDYRGTAGSAYFDLPGDIAILASGGGASLTAMDVLLAAGGNPANYTEYSGNPSREKVKKLTNIVLSKSNLHGLWVVGAIANFTDIFETLSGLIEAVRSVSPKPKFPIVIRRGGPRDQEAFEMLRQITDINLHLYGQEISITESAKIMASLAKKYADTSK